MPTIFDTREVSSKKNKEHSTSLLSRAKLSREQHHSLHSFCLYPSMHFEGQHTDETVILLLRAHPVTQLPWVIITVVALLMLPFFSIVISQFINQIQVVFLVLLYLGMLYTFSLLSYMSWLFNVGIITDERVIDLDYRGILYREFTASEIAEVTDVTAKSGGFIQSLLNYGGVFIQTAGMHQNIEFAGISRPNEVVSLVNELMQQAENESG